MMELDETIKHAEEVANEKERLGAMGRGNPDKYAPSPEKCFECAEEHRQLAERLKERKALREQKRLRGTWTEKFDKQRRWRCSACNVYNYYGRPDFCPCCSADGSCPCCGANRREGGAE